MSWKSQWKTLIVAGALLLPTFAVAQSTPNLDKRERKQQQRIRQGVRSGELTPAEKRHLEARERKLKKDEAKAKADGEVTPTERARLQREANRDSRAIYRQKHDAQHQ